MADKNTLRNWFLTNLKPTQAQFWALFDSYFHKDEKIPITAIDDIENILAEKADAEVLAHHLTDATAHADLFGAKEDKNKRGAALGYAPLNEFTKLAIDYLNVVNDLVTGGESSLLTAEQGKLLQVQITAINTLLTSNDINLDTVQEIVNAIKTVQTSLSTILVNDLTTGGTTKALTAEMGKTLKGLIDAMTTALGNKVDKVAGERLINAGEITKLAGLGSIATTVKPILSTALATQNVAGLVTYINALTPVLVVGGSEIVKYNLTDTGRVFELNLRGRSFGAGQAAIVAADVLEVTDFLNKDIRLSNYPSTRNDGQLPTNKVLAPDVNGNIKLYTIATAPAPYLEVLVPDSTLPSTTTNFTLKGAFFTPTMTVAIAGQTVNYITFKSDNLVLVNVTTGATEGSYAVTLNNGIQAIFPNALLIVLGTVYTPIESDWITRVGTADYSIKGEFNLLQANNLSKGVVNKTIWKTPNTGDFHIYFNWAHSPFYTINATTGGWGAGSSVDHTIELLDATTDALIVGIKLEQISAQYSRFYINRIGQDGDATLYNYGDGSNDFVKSIQVAFKRNGGILGLYTGNILRYSLATQPNNAMYLKVSSKFLDIKNIKLVTI